MYFTAVHWSMAKDWCRKVGKKRLKRAEDDPMVDEWCGGCGLVMGRWEYNSRTDNWGHLPMPFADVGGSKRHSNSCPCQINGYPDHELMVRHKKIPKGAKQALEEEMRKDRLA